MNKHTRTLVIGDIHGGLLALKEVLQKAQITSQDQLIFLGDYVDGWSDSAATVSYLITLSQKHNCIFIRGNHDELVYQYLQGQSMSDNWLKHGGNASKKAYDQLTQVEIKAHCTFFEQMLDYHIDSANRMYCHAGFQNLNGPQHEWYSTAFYWDRTLWEMVCALDPDLSPADVTYPKRLQIFHEIYIGHTPVTRIGANLPVQKANVWNIDTGAAFQGPISILDVDTKTVWQSDPVWQLYPHEVGRNPKSFRETQFS